MKKIYLIISMINVILFLLISIYMINIVNNYSNDVVKVNVEEIK